MVKVWPSQIAVHRDFECVALHQRCYGRGHQLLNLEHYLDVLEKKPGAMAGSTPLQQWRAAGRWPECLDPIWRKLESRHGRGGGTREMISLVRAGPRAQSASRLQTPSPCSPERPALSQHHKLAHVRMIQSRHGARLAVEPLGESRLRDFDGHDAVDARGASIEDFSHAAPHQSARGSHTAQFGVR